MAYLNDNNGEFCVGLRSETGGGGIEKLNSFGVIFFMKLMKWKKRDN